MTTKQELSALDRKLAFWQATDAEHKTDKRNTELVQELLAALVEMEGWARQIDDEDSRVPVDIRQKARAAIAKARGQS